MGSNNNNVNVKRDYCSYIKIEPIVRPSRRCRCRCRRHENKNMLDIYNDSRLESMSNDWKAEEEQQMRRKRRRSRRKDRIVEEIVERLETRMDQKIRNHTTEMNKKIDQLNIDVSSK